MHRTQTSRQDPRPFRARLSALVCLLVWFAANPSLLAASVAALGMLDGQHRVRLAQHEGKVTVVFHHQGGAPAREHHHSLLMNALTALAEDSDSNQDHTLVFARTGSATAAAPLTLPVCKSAELPPSLLRCVALAVPRTIDAPPLVPHPPPPCAFALVCLRSTTLLI